MDASIRCLDARAPAHADAHMPAQTARGSEAVGCLRLWTRTAAVAGKVIITAGNSAWGGTKVCRIEILLLNGYWWSHNRRQWRQTRHHGRHRSDSIHSPGRRGDATEAGGGQTPGIRPV